jgi:hypothetical protein
VNMSGGCHSPETLVFSVGRTIYDTKRDRGEEIEWSSKSRVDRMAVMKQYTVYYWQIFCYITQFKLKIIYFVIFIFVLWRNLEIALSLLILTHSNFLMIFEVSDSIY